MGTSTSFFFSGAADRKILSRNRSATFAFHSLRLRGFPSSDCALASSVGPTGHARFVRQSSRLGRSAAPLVLRRLGESGPRTPACEKSQRVGLWKLRVLVAGPAFRKSAGGTRRTIGIPSMGGMAVAIASERHGAIMRQVGSGVFSRSSRNWRDAVYVTIDLDCLRAEDAVTNWESGRFSLDDLAWGSRELRTPREHRRRYVRRVFPSGLRAT